MTFRAIARRYAGALFDVGRKSGQLDRLGEELRALVDLVAANRELRILFESALVPPTTKRAVVDGVLAAAHGISGEVRRLLEFLSERNRLHLIDEIAEIFEERLRQHHRIISADVVTAAPLSDAARIALRQALSRATESEVRLRERVDPEIIGGLTATVGSVVFDGSVTTYLERLRQQLHQG